MQLAVVIPCFCVKNQILDVIAQMPKTVQKIYVIDDACPERSGEHVKKKATDPRVEVLFHKANQGVGGAVVTG